MSNLNRIGIIAAPSPQEPAMQDPTTGQIPVTQGRSAFRLYKALVQLATDKDTLFSPELLNLVSAGTSNSHHASIPNDPSIRTFATKGGDLLSLMLAMRCLHSTFANMKKQPPYRILIAGTLETALLALNLKTSGITESVVFVANQLLQPLQHWGIPLSERYMDTEAKCLEEADALVFPSHSQREQFLTYYPRMSSVRTECITHGTSSVCEQDSMEESLPEKKRLKNKRKNNQNAILFMASPIHPQSDFRTAFCALRRIIGGWAGEVNLKIAGPPRLDSSTLRLKGELLGTLKTAMELNVLENIEFLGYLNPTEMQREYFNSDITIVSSVIEAFGDIVSESLYELTPIVATHTGAIADLVQGKEQGFIVPPRTPWIMAERALQLLNIVKAEDYEATENISTPVRRITWHNAAKRYAALFRDILSPRHEHKTRRRVLSNEIRYTLTVRLQESGLSIRELAKKVDKAFESVRRVFDEDSSPHLRWTTVEPIAKVLCSKEEYLDLERQFTQL